jgi:hypothetical protein
VAIVTARAGTRAQNHCRSGFTIVSMTRGLGRKLIVAVAGAGTLMAAAGGAAVASTTGDTVRDTEPVVTRELVRATEDGRYAYWYAKGTVALAVGDTPTAPERMANARIAAVADATGAERPEPVTPVTDVVAVVDSAVDTVVEASKTGAALVSQATSRAAATADDYGP